MKKGKKYKAKSGVAMASEPVVTYNAPAAFNQYVIEDKYSLVRKTREGVTTEAFYLLTDVIKMPEKSLAAVLNLSARTISNYRDQHKSLDPANSEHLLKLINLFSRGRRNLVR